MLSVNGKVGAVNLIYSDVGAAPDNHSHNAANTTTNGYMSSVDKAKLDAVAVGATKTEKSITNGNVKINGTDTKIYTHPENHNA